MGMGKHRNRVYVTDLGLATERHEVQIKTVPADVIRPTDVQMWLDTSKQSVMSSIAKRSIALG